MDACCENVSAVLITTERHALKLGIYLSNSIAFFLTPSKHNALLPNIILLLLTEQHTHTQQHTLLISRCVLGILTYKTIFRSHFSSLAPSSYTARGSFARIGIPAPPNFNYATRSQRDKLEQIGKWWGCHTCGSRMIFSNLRSNKPKFHGDHIPPVSVAKQMNSKWYRQKLGVKVPQRFYPQCRDCSNKQGGLLSKAVNLGHRNLHSVGGGQESYFHGRRLRIGHLTGGVVAALSVGTGVDGELAKTSRVKVCSVQQWMENVGRGLIEHAKASFWKGVGGG